MEELLNVSPIDGRYYKKTHVLENYFSEYALIKNRVFVEIKWLLFLASKKFIFELKDQDKNKINSIIENFNIDEAKKVKEIEKTTNHDVKAVEYYLREKFTSLGLGNFTSYIHIFLTSEDINNTSYNLMIKTCLEDVYFKQIQDLIANLKEKSLKYKDVAMLSHTHGQVATPTTVGKEFKVFEYRLEKIFKRIKEIKLCSKFGGAVGNFNCHIVAYPNINWEDLAKEFICSIGLEYNPVSTQIESHDTICLLLSFVKLLNCVIKDLNSDMWLYISKGYFKEKIKNNEVGSSVMPHKVNPINHENSMANIEICNGIIDVLTTNLPVSRMQRDLSDSSKMRNIGVVFAHSLISVSETIKGLNKIEVNTQEISEELDNNYEVLAEAIQTILRKNKVENGYEMLKSLTRGKKITKIDMQEFVSTLQIDENDKRTLLNLSPNKYVGLAEKIVENN